MIVITSPSSAAPAIKNEAQTRTVALVPTMGALHNGHLALIQRALADGHFTVASIFVNPIQFNNPEDLAKYPHMPDRDLTMLQQAGCHAVFMPTPADMYPTPPTMRLSFGALEHVLEGAFRPGHFSGVGIVVAKLFHLTGAQVAYFGQKDLQQLAVVRRLVQDLSFPIQIVGCPTVREADGLAMSSRNLRLTPEERMIAPKVYQGLQLAASSNGPVDDIRTKVIDFWSTFASLKPEYLEAVHPDTFETYDKITGSEPLAWCCAVQLGSVRLIDNIIVRP